jgi:hypothetical protein
MPLTTELGGLIRGAFRPRPVQRSARRAPLREVPAITAGLFEPESLLPSQYFDRIRHRTDLTGEERLIRAIIEDAVDVYLRHATATLPRYRELFGEAERWIESDDSEWLFSFETICDHLRLDSGSLRRGLRACKRRARAAEATVRAGRARGPRCRWRASNPPRGAAVTTRTGKPNQAWSGC